MKRLTSLVCLAGLVSACAPMPLPDPGGQRWLPLDHTPPPDVIAALPPGVGVDDMIARYDPGREGPCYYYNLNGRRHPLVTQEMRKAGITDAPLCVLRRPA